MAIEFEKVKLKYEDGFLYDLDGNKMNDEPEYEIITNHYVVSETGLINGFVAGISADDQTVYFGLEDNTGEYHTPFEISTNHEMADRLVAENRNEVDKQMKHFEQMIFDLTNDEKVNESPAL